LDLGAAFGRGVLRGGEASEPFARDGFHQRLLVGEMAVNRRRAHPDPAATSRSETSSGPRTSIRVRAVSSSARRKSP
jgi:hypothetical protein